MANAYVAGLVPRIRQILKSSDLSTISAKGVRKTLISEGEDEATIKDNRKEIDAQIAAIYEEFCKDEEEDESSDDEPLTNNRRDSASHHNAHAQSSQPEPLKKKPKVESTREAKPQVESDEAMAARMQAEFDDMIRGGRGQRSTSKSKPKKKSSSSSKKKRSASDIEDSDDEKPKKRAGGGGVFNKELILSDALGGWLGEERLSRPQTVKRIWAYVKENGLQDQSDKRYILCDSEMQRVFNTEKLHMFTMNKLLSAHFRDPDDVV
ncbi:hypothetical protein Q8F55_000267 [Vanrija albida]|uniref:DM2 domain-containing protein n=1 Tax=Vanrija albida TaxID=181172 RepID=A0ABR3QCS4_9TREE